MQAGLQTQQGIYFERAPKRERASSGALLALNLSLAVIAAGACIASFIFLPWQEWKIFACAVFLIIFAYALYRAAADSAIRRPIVKAKDTPVSKLCLLDEANGRIKEWPLINRVSLVIGRDDTGHRDVDIDLADVQYASLISEQHAVLNYACSEWFIEELHTENGVRLQKSGDSTPYKLSKKAPCRLSAGDIIHIAHTRLLVQ